MARSINEIKRSMTDAFMADATLRRKYGLSDGQKFEDCFSSVSLESILFYIVAACCHILEVLFDRFKDDVESKVRRAVVASIPWYHKMALAFQYGDALTFDADTCQYVYPNEDHSRRVVKYAAVRDRGNSIDMLVSGDRGGLPVPLSKDVLMVFEDYMNKVKVAGVVISVKSLPPDSIIVNATVRIDPMLMRNDGSLIADGRYPVVDAINGYLNNIVYGGAFNKMKLVDAIQEADGVVDIELGTCQYSIDGGNTWQDIFGNNYSSIGGSFVAAGLSNSIHYVV